MIGLEATLRPRITGVMMIEKSKVLSLCLCVCVCVCYIEDSENLEPGVCDVEFV